MKLNCNSISHRITEGIIEIAITAHAQQLLKLNVSMTIMIKEVQIQYTNAALLGREGGMLSLHNSMTKSRLIFKLYKVILLWHKMSIKCWNASHDLDLFSRSKTTALLQHCIFCWRYQCSKTVLAHLEIYVKGSSAKLDTPKYVNMSTKYYQWKSTKSFATLLHSGDLMPPNFEI